MSYAWRDYMTMNAFEAGFVGVPSVETGATGSSNLDADQKAAVIGDPVPIVFCRRNETSGTGGILISPLATEARFQNSATTNEVTVYWHLILGDGQMGSIQRRDVFWRGYRVGTYTQTYDRRAGTWTPGNFITDLATFQYTPDCPKYCGNIGTYPGISTLSFQFTVPNTNVYSPFTGTVVYETVPDNKDWKKQVNCFIRNGMYVTRLVDSVTGPSNNYADLVKWLYLNSSKLQAAQLDNTALATAANFLAANGFACDIEIKDSGNLADFIAKTAPYFLLGESRNGGKRGLKPLLPITSAYTINTNPIAWSYTFTEENVIPGTLEISYTSLADRRPFCVQVMWRQQPTDDFGIMRTSEVRYAGTAESGPYEQHDMSAFCTNENHAVKAGTYILARRRYVTHTATVTLKAGDYSMSLDAGNIIRLYLQRNAAGTAPAVHDYLYEVNRISKTLAGDLSLELTHLPIDDLGRSLVALEVAAAVGNGITISSNKTGPTRDTYGSGDTSVPAEAYSTGTALDDQITLAPYTASSPNGPRDPAGDDLNNQGPPAITTSQDGAYIGSYLGLEGIPCDSLELDWYRDGVLVSSAHNDFTYFLTSADAGYDIEAVITCSDGRSYTTEPVNAGTPTMPASFTGNVNMRVITSYVDCVGGSCVQIEQYYVMGEFTAADSRTFYISSSLFGANQCGSFSACPPIGGGCGAYPGCLFDVYSMDVYWRLGRVSIPGTNFSFPKVLGGNDLTARLIAVPA
jgi:hypothetical protein